MNLVRRINETILVDYFILFILHRQLLRTRIQLINAVEGAVRQ